MTACFTGHRPNKLNGYNPKDNKELLWKISNKVESLIKGGYDNFITGGALGIDTWAALIVLKLKEKYSNVKLTIAIPCKNQESKWRQENKIEYLSILDKADSVVYVSEEEYTPWCMQKRNEYMVDNSDIVIAVWDGSNGGTGNCVRYAEKQDKRIINLW